MKMFLEIKGEVVFSILIATTVLFLLAAFIIVFVIVYQRRKGAHLNEMAAIKSHFQKVLLETKLEIKEQTLQHIATELHDNLGQIASLIKINLNTLSLEDTKAQNEKLEDTKELTRQLIADVKLLSLSLNSDRIVQVGIGKSLEIEVSRLSKSGYFQASFVQSGEVPVLTPNFTIFLYRMAQETINNIVKHSRARHITVQLECFENMLTLIISDDGKGFDKDIELKAGGSGLTNLYSRAKLMNASLDITTGPGLGTTVSIQLPY